MIPLVVVVVAPYSLILLLDDLDGLLSSLLLFFALYILYPTTDEINQSKAATPQYIANPFWRSGGWIISVPSAT